MRLAAVLAALLLMAAPAYAGIPAAVSQTPPAHDQANAVIAGSLTDTTSCSATPSTATAGCSAMFMPGANSLFNIVFGGSSGPNGSWTATIEIDHSFDGGSTWYVASFVGGGGAQAIFSTPNQDVSIQAFEPENGELWRIRCTAYTSGTISYRMSVTGGASPTYGN